MTSATDIPLDPPVASSASLSQPRESGRSRRLTAGNTPRETRTRSQSERVGRHGLESVRDELSERDWAILRSVADHRFLTTHHIEMLHFDGHASSSSAARSCRHVLKRLHDKRIVRCLERRVGGVRAGSAAYVWTTGPVGRRLLSSPASTHMRRHQEPSERFLRHALAIADVHVALIAADRRADIELLTLSLEPHCWRRYLAAGGSRAVLQPDLAATTGAGDYEDAWFIEVDLGSEHLPTLIRKCEQYETYRRTGIEQQRYGSFPLVVWLLPSDKRVDDFQAALNRTRAVDQLLFLVTTPAGLLPLMTTNEPKGGDS